ncbi:VacJ family lipoprotein [Neptunicella sp. SCSIO 80796]|uniref:MlaA family lipoprotein n=1 Tax=Neptunicella plasticusilytica TaxID=3117012 RepID=UPI003A4E4E5C
MGKHGDYPERLWIKYFILTLLLFISGCASQPDSEPQEVIGQQDQPAASQMEVTSSHGTDVLEPTVVGYEPQTFEDPLESINRPIFAFNDVVYRYALIPAAKGYLKVMPEPAQQSVSNFFANIREPLNAVNHLMQANGSNMGKSLARFVINSTVGILGFFDPADAWFGIKEHKSTLGDTLHSYGVDYGAYLVLPLLGQSDTRNGFSTIVESMANPIHQVTDDPQTLYIQSYGGFHDFAPQAETYEKMAAESQDKYIFFRNLYLEGLLRDEQYKDE